MVLKLVKKIKNILFIYFDRQYPTVKCLIYLKFVNKFFPKFEYYVI